MTDSPITPTTISCKICDHSARFMYDIKNGALQPPLLHIYLCSNCGLLFVGNIPTDAQLGFAYDSVTTDNYYDEINSTTTTKMLHAVHDLEPLLKAHTPPVSVLDVGAGYGHFCEELHKALPMVDVVAQEIPGNAAAVCAKKGLKVYTTNIDEIPERFYIVTLMDVAEHVPQPNQIFAACNVVLDPQGYIYIHTPRHCFWDSFFLAFLRIPGLHRLAMAWLQTRVTTFHLHLWTDKALKISLEKAGFKMVEYKTEMEFSWPLERYGKVYLQDKLHLPAPVIKLTLALANLVFIDLRTMKNKAIVLGQKVATVKSNTQAPQMVEADARRP